MDEPSVNHNQLANNIFFPFPVEPGSGDAPWHLLTKPVRRKTPFPLRKASLLFFVFPFNAKMPSASDKTAPPAESTLIPLAAAWLAVTSCISYSY